MLPWKAVSGHGRFEQACLLRTDRMLLIERTIPCDGVQAKKRDVIGARSRTSRVVLVSYYLAPLHLQGVHYVTMDQK